MRLDQIAEEKIKGLFPGIPGITITGSYKPQPEGDDADYTLDPMHELWIEVCTDEDTPIHFTFERMKQLSEILGTEHMNFDHYNGDHLADSVTWDGCNVLRIVVWWGDRPEPA